MNPRSAHLIRQRLPIIAILILLALFPAASAVDNGFIAAASTPSGARIFVDGVYQSVTPWKGIFPPGSHTLKLTYPGYADYEESFVLHPFESKDFNVQMAQLALFSFSSNPVGAKVYVNGVWKGYTNMEVEPVPLGSTYTVKIVKDGYQPYETSVVIHEDTHIHADLVPSAAAGTLSVTSIPSEARVLVDGAMVGLTPYSGTTATGAHTVKVTKINYNDYTTTVTVEESKTTTVFAALNPAPQPAGETGSVSVISTPAGANVYIDGVYYGAAPVSADLAPASHLIKVSMPGYNDFTTTVTIAAAQSLPLYATLTAASSGTAAPTVASPQPGGTQPTTQQAGQGSVMLYSRPPGAKVYIDGTYIGIAPAGRRSVTAGTHAVLFTLAGYEDFSASVTVSAGETAEFTAAMSPSGQGRGTGSSAQGTRAPGFGIVLSAAGLLVYLAARRIRER